MKMKTESFKKSIAALVIVAALSLVMTLAYFGGLLNFLEYKLYDFRVNFTAPHLRPSDDIILVLLDQDSLDWARQERGWGWPWPRAAYAELTDYIGLGRAASLAFDVIFSEPSVHGGEDDRAFAEAASRFGKTAQIVVFSSQTGNAESWPNDLYKPLFQLRNFESMISEYEQMNQNVVSTGRMKAQFPVKELRDSAAIIGNVSGWADSDQIFRRNNLFSIFDGKAVPGLSAASLLVSGASNQITFNEEKKAIEWGDRVIPVDKHGRSILRFKGTLDRYAPYYAWQVLQSAEDYKNGKEPVIYPEDFNNRHVFFGLYAQGLFDIFSNPISSVYAGVGMHITMLDNILAQDFVRESPVWINILLIIGAIILVVILSLYCHRIVFSISGTVLILAVFAAVAMAAYHFSSLWMPMAAPLFAIIFAFITTSVYNYVTEGSKKRFIKSAFSQYLSPEVIEQIILDPSKLNLGGETREMSAIFTDIQRFSSISEALQKEYGEGGPRALVNLLNLYLTEMSNVILDHKGTIDKYEGDAIIAFFGAPVWTEKHAALACRSALLMKKCEAAMYDKVMNPAGEFYKPLSALIESGAIRRERPLFTRLGINSGDMVVGNMGTPNKMNYTIMGNAVNLAARLEGVNKQYNTFGILISEYTKAKIGDEFVVRGLSRVRVVGVNTPLRLYELLGLREEASKETLDMVKSWEQGFGAYENKDFLAAKNTFARAHQKNANDGTAKLYLDRCEKYLASPPTPEKWDDGVDSLTEK
jgi:adenylate cyclase